MTDPYSFFSEETLKFKRKDFPDKGVSGLNWQPHGNSVSFQEINLGDFSAALLRAGIVDLKTMPLAGAQIWLPYGNALLNKFRDKVHALYRQESLDEYSYPLVVPTEIYTPTDHFHPVKNKILYALSPREKAHTGEKALNPTGESSIYWHWKRLVKNADLPIRMYQRTNYYRPLAENVPGNIFKGYEARDVFEFHCCHPTYESMKADIRRSIHMLQSLYADMGMPIIWSTRPLWTNNNKVHKGSFAADLYLPNDKTIQTSAVYQQEDIFSKAYDVKIREKGKDCHTYHLTGYCSQRALLSHLFLAMGAVGRFVVPVSVSPCPAEIIFNWKSEDSEKIKKDLEGLMQCGVSIWSDVSQGEISKKLSMSERQGIPLTVLVQGKRSSSDLYKVVFIRRDCGKEVSLLLKELNDEFYMHVQDILRDIEKEIHNSCALYVERSTHHVDGDVFKESGVPGKGIYVIPLEAKETSVLQLERKIKGEVIGFVGARSPGKCAISGMVTTNKAIVSRRM